MIEAAAQGAGIGARFALIEAGSQVLTPRSQQALVDSKQVQPCAELSGIDNVRDFRQATALEDGDEQTLDLFCIFDFHLGGMLAAESGDVILFE